MNTKEKIFQSAKKLFMERGYFNTSVEEIVKEAGISKGGFYFYFKSKEHMFKELLQANVQKLFKKLEEYRRTDLPLEEKLKEILKTMLESLYEDKEVGFIFFFQLVGSSEEFRKLYFEKSKYIRSLFQRLIEEEAQKGSICKGVDPEVIASLLLGLIRVVYLDLLLRQDLTLEASKEKVQKGVEIVMRGIRC
ncbi:TetR/AcrR family transcriptional regulator [Thermocrinis minervae]|uniref:Transcriptional regulator, TetR family n=1 Tax=Thermocrinis minervae TaxID=381751 RepID=A0A1M6THY3_9AQUI|nr:TetR/AcrR family transcriptional regulator [Thermocrinis minervae]SHK56567.1 transcriptional regulator, TetR family [Thermocrinis minervae]